MDSLGAVVSFQLVGDDQITGNTRFEAIRRKETCNDQAIIPN